MNALGLCPVKGVVRSVLVSRGEEALQGLLTACAAFHAVATSFISRGGALTFGDTFAIDSLLK